MLFFSAPADYREEWIDHMATALPDTEIVSVYDIAASRLRKFTLFPEREGVHKYVLNAYCRPLDAVRHVRRERPDLIIFHGYALPSFLAAIGYCILAGIRYSFFSDANALQEHRADRSPVTKSLLAFFVRHAYRLFFSSTMNQRYWERVGARSEQFVPLWFPVNSEKIQKQLTDRTLLSSLRGRYLNPADRLVIYCGRFAADKGGVETLLRAMATLPEKYKIILVGDGPQRADLELLTTALDIAGHTRFLGSLPNEQAILHIAASDLLVLPSEQEAFGLVLNEAIAAGLPVIASDIVGAAYDLIDEGKNGFVFKRGDYKQLAEKIIACESLSREDIERKRQEVLEKFSFRQNAQSLEMVLNELR